MPPTPSENAPAEGSQPKTSFRAAPVRQRTIWESWAVLPAKTRLRISLGITAVAAAGIIIADQLEKVLPPPPKKPDRLAESATKETPPQAS